MEIDFGINRDMEAYTWPPSCSFCQCIYRRLGTIRSNSSFVRVMATWSSRSSSSISSEVLVALAEGMQPSTTFKTRTIFHSPPLAEWIVDELCMSSSSCVARARPLVASGGSGNAEAGRTGAGSSRATTGAAGTRSTPAAGTRAAPATAGAKGAPAAGAKVVPPLPEPKARLPRTAGVLVPPRRARRSLPRKMALRSPSVRTVTSLPFTTPSAAWMFIMV